MSERPAWFLRGIDIFQGLDCAQIDSLGAIIHDKEFARGDLIAAPWESSPTLFLVRRGRVKLCLLGESGKEHILALLDAGGIFGDLLETGGFGQKVFAYAAEPSLICAIKRDDFLVLLSREPVIAMKVIGNLARRLADAETQIETLALQTAPQRLATLLLRLGERYGESDGVALRLSLKLTHQDMADMCALSRQTVTTLLNEWEKEGSVRKEGRRFHLLPHRLQEKVSPLSAA